MDFNWQTLAALAVVGWACWRLVRRGVAAWQGTAKKSCGSCASCSGDVKTLPLVEIREHGTTKSRV